MPKRVVIALFVTSATTAFAQTTPTVVIRPNVAPAEVAPWIYRKGNLRVSIGCAEDEATPSTGRALTLDAIPQIAQRVNGSWATLTDSDGNDSSIWNASDVGYLLAPGHHH